MTGDEGLQREVQITAVFKPGPHRPAVGGHRKASGSERHGQGCTCSGAGSGAGLEVGAQVTLSTLPILNTILASSEYTENHSVQWFSVKVFYLPGEDIWHCLETLLVVSWVGATGISKYKFSVNILQRQLVMMNAPRLRIFDTQMLTGMIETLG